LQADGQTFGSPLWAETAGEERAFSFQGVRCTRDSFFLGMPVAEIIEEGEGSGIEAGGFRKES
jgi:hypothetical protein